MTLVLMQLIHDGRTGSVSMSVEEPEPHPRCSEDSPRPLPCLVDSALARQLTVKSPARAYVVWRLPGAAVEERLWAGLHLGEDSWEGLQVHFEQEQYKSGRDRLRRLHVAPGEDIVAAGRALFRAEASKHGVSPSPFRIWIWPSSLPQPPPSSQAARSPQPASSQSSDLPSSSPVSS
eukprot:127642-Amphidinium_carterae.2